MTTTDADPDTVGGERVLEWIASEEGRAFAARWGRRRGLGTDSAVLDDVLADAQVAVLRAMRSRGLRVHNPAAYGTQVIKSVVRSTSQGRDRDRTVLAAVGLRGDVDAVPGAGAGADADHDPDADVGSDDVLLDDLRTVIEVMADPTRPWLTGAALAYLTLSDNDADLSDEVPQPRAGATPVQARGWAALWFTGVRDVFPGPQGDPAAQRRKRGRHVDKVLEHLRVAFSRHLLHRREVTGG